ncbi:hypothetical protein K6119_04105 [Paracrocinitomix mangrovi]|uniref:hypothetical protein n=1 Tax=Paracrocinitomix mangrovi TaxID=2862509 RepID=UPI001EDC348C|nr:hypothetical protein [Paracrocinitomix mangrovi]UKN02696.1 hypothetical protein K6119_04105 [Paracrocinitomix mangrovi]
MKLESHFKNGNYIISVHDSVRNNLKERFTALKDSSAFMNDTVDLKSVDSYWTKRHINRVLRECIELNKARIYSISESRYIYNLNRIVSKSKFNEVHNSYLYANVENGDTILFSYSFDQGTFPF